MLMGFAHVNMKRIKKISFIGLLDENYETKDFYLKNELSNDNLLYIGETDKVQFITYLMLTKKFIIKRNNIFPIYLENGLEKVSDFKFRRHGKCTRKNYGA